MSERRYAVREIFYSLQGEGARAGTANVFVRFAGCNLQCVDAARLPRAQRAHEVDAGFTCDTDFHRVDHRVTAAQLADLVAAEDRGRCLWAILTGGEPLLQVDAELLACLRARGYRLALETNGTLPLPGELDWVSCSPKRGVPTRIDPKSVSEVRVVLGAGQSPTVDWGRVRFVSPAHQAPPAEEIAGFHPEASDLETADLAWCIRWCLDHPEWRLSVQQHKAWGVR